MSDTWSFGWFDPRRPGDWQVTDSYASSIAENDRSVGRDEENGWQMILDYDDWFVMVDNSGNFLMEWKNERSSE